MRRRNLPLAALGLLLACSGNTIFDSCNPPARVDTLPLELGATEGPLTGQQVAELQVLLSELARPPLGTGAVLSLSLDGRTQTITVGRLWEGGPATRPDSPFNWASVSKVVTAAKVHALAHQGRINLDDSVHAHLPGVALVDGKKRNRSAEITLRQLLMHRGGLPHQPRDLDPRNVGSDWGDPALLQKLTESWTIELIKKPGEYGYSNTGYVLLASIVERLEEETFADLMGEFLAELHMDDSTFWSPTLGDGAAHGRVQRGSSVQFNEPGWYASRYGLPFTGLWAPAPDVVRLGEALIAAHADPGAALHPMTVFDTGHGPGPIRGKRLGAMSLEHDGSASGFLSWFGAIPEKKLAVAIVCNGGAESRDHAKLLARVVERSLEVILAPQAAHADVR